MGKKKIYRAFVDAGYGAPEYDEVMFSTENDAYERANIAVQDMVAFGAEELTDEQIINLIEDGTFNTDDFYEMIIENGLEEEYPLTYEYLMEEED